MSETAEKEPEIKTRFFEIQSKFRSININHLGAVMMVWYFIQIFYLLFNPTVLLIDFAYLVNFPYFNICKHCH